MLRIALLALLVIIVGVAVYFPKFRRTLSWTLIILLVAIGAVIWQDVQERQLAFQRIPLVQAQLSHMAVRPGLNSRSFVITGRLQNANRDFTMLSVTIQATIEDCHALICEVVGQEKMDISLEVPPTQARDFSMTIPFPTEPKVLGTPAWRFEVVQVRAR